MTGSQKTMTAILRLRTNSPVCLISCVICAPNCRQGLPVRTPATTNSTRGASRPVIDNSGAAIALHSDNLRRTTQKPDIRQAADDYLTGVHQTIPGPVH